MRHSFRRAVSGCLLALSSVIGPASAAAQDTVVADGRLLAAVGDFGLELGPAPRVRQQDLFGGGRYTSGGSTWLVTSDGRHLFFGAPSSAGPFSPPRLAVLHTATGVATASAVPAEQGSIGPGAVLDEVRRRVFALRLFGGAQVAVLSCDLTPIGVAAVPSCNNVVISSHTGPLYLGRWADYQGQGARSISRLWTPQVTLP